MYLKITLHSAAAEEIIKNYITFLDPGGINYVIIVGPTVNWTGPIANGSDWSSTPSEPPRPLLTAFLDFGVVGL